ncbi:MAG: urease accessory UreF family protein [Hyphomicrobiales bacterium]
MAASNQGLLRLMSWLSPVFPTGGFAYSGGLERAVADGLVTNEAELQSWLYSLIHFGSMRNDLILLSESWRCAKSDMSCVEVAQLALALAGSSERYLEQTAQGSAFVLAVENWIFDRKPNFGNQHPLPVVVGGYGAVGGIDLNLALVGYLQAFVTNQLQAAIRLSVLGQSGAARIMASLEAEISELADTAAESGLDDLGSAAINADIASMNHETQTVRLFRS